MLDDRQKIGVGLTGFGVLFTILGVLFFFDRGLLAMGDLLFISGVATTIGPHKALKFFIKPKNIKGTAFFLGGTALVVIGWTMVGMAVETYGFWVLFSGFIPTVLGFLRKVPILGRILDLPVLKTVINRVAPAGGLPV